MESANRQSSQSSLHKKSKETTKQSPTEPIPETKLDKSGRKKQKHKVKLVKSLSATDLLEITGDNLVKHDPGSPSEPVNIKDVNRNNRMTDSSTISSIPDTEPGIDRREELKRKQKRFHRLFASVPNSDLLVCRFSCAYLNDKGVLIQGHLYVSRNWICFYANIFGLKKTIQIPFASVVRISKEKTAKIIPNAVAVQTETNHYFFGSLISRDNTYQLLVTFFEKSRELFGMPVAAGTKEAIADSIIKEEEPHVVVDDSGSSVGENSDDELSDVSATAVVIGRKNFSSQTAATFGSQSKLSVKNWTSWFSRQPTIIMILFLCIIGMLFLFLCAAFLTLRLLYIHSASNSLWQHDISNSPFTGSNTWLDSSSLERVNSALDNTIQYLHQVRNDLELLRLEFVTVKSSCAS